VPAHVGFAPDARERRAAAPPGAAAGGREAAGEQAVEDVQRAALSIIPERRQRRNKERSAVHVGRDHYEPRDARFVVATSVALAPFPRLMSLDNSNG